MKKTAKHKTPRTQRQIILDALVASAQPMTAAETFAKVYVKNKKNRGQAACKLLGRMLADELVERVSGDGTREKPFKYTLKTTAPEMPVVVSKKQTVPVIKAKNKVVTAGDVSGPIVFGDRPVLGVIAGIKAKEPRTDSHKFLVTRNGQNYVYPCCEHALANMDKDSKLWEFVPVKQVTTYEIIE